MSSEQNSRTREWFIVWAVLLLAVACFAGVVRYEFVFDDAPLIKENPRLRSWSYFPGYFQMHLAGHMYPTGNYYRPVLLTWMRLNYVLFGLQPGGWHAATLLAHVVCVVLVFFVARRIAEDEVASAGAALLFALHPVHVECVAWVMGVTEPLAAAFTLGAFLAYLRWRDGGAEAWPLAALVLFVLGLLAKENAIVLPGIIFVYEFMRGVNAETGVAAEESGSPPLFERGKDAFRRSLPFALAVAIYLAVRMAMLGALTHPMTPMPVGTTLLTLPSVLVFYMKLLVWPVGLSAFYDFSNVTEAGAGSFWWPLAICLAASTILFFVARRNARLAVAVAWLVLPIIPLLNLSVFLRGEVVHDRYLYLSSVGFCLLVGLGLRQMRRLSPGLSAVPVVVVVSLLALTYGGISFSIQEHWRNNLNLYTRGHAIAPGNATAATNLGGVLFDSGKVEEAGRLFQQAIASDPNYWQAWFNLGYSEYRHGNYPKAEEYLRRAIAAEPREADAHVRLGVTLWRMGRAREGVAAIEHAIRLRPTAQGYHFSLGVILETNGLLKEALAEYDAELAINPNQPSVRKQRDALAVRLK